MSGLQASSAPLAGKRRQLFLLATAELLAMGLWFSASAVVPQLTAVWNLSANQKSWLTMSVQIGFVSGALVSALFNIPDRISSRTLMGVCALLGATFNAAIPVFGVTVQTALVLRFLTGITLAGVYPPGMKLMASWCKEDRGFGIGLLVGALTLGSGLPHLLNAVAIFGNGGLPPWSSVLIATSLLAIVAGLVSLLLVRPGPYLSQSAPFDLRFAGKLFADRAVRLANFGYLGHMWELYAMWAWTPALILASYQGSGMPARSAGIAAFSVIAIGAIGCIAAGLFADRLGRTAIAIASMAISGACALFAGFLFHSPLLLTLVCLIWGFAVVADSAQFSAAVSELTDARYVGTALTLQTSLGFLLTLFTIRMVPPLVDRFGWGIALMFLAIGPAFGVLSMARLRSLPEAARMASGHR